MLSSTNPCIAAQLRQLIFYNLDNDLLQNALFLAERLHALDPRSADSIHLLALCNLRLGRYKAAYDCSKERGWARGSHPGCTYVFAQACLALELHTDGIAALERAIERGRGPCFGKSHWSEFYPNSFVDLQQDSDASTSFSQDSETETDESSLPDKFSRLQFFADKHSESSRRDFPDLAAVHRLLGKLWKGAGNWDRAVDHYSEALKLNPFMWDAFTDLCDAGMCIFPSAHASLICRRCISDSLEYLQDDTRYACMSWNGW